MDVIIPVVANAKKKKHIKQLSLRQFLEVNSNLALVFAVFLVIGLTFWRILPDLSRQLYYYHCTAADFRADLEVAGHHNTDKFLLWMAGGLFVLLINLLIYRSLWAKKLLIVGCIVFVITVGLTIIGQSVSQGFSCLDF